MMTLAQLLAVPVATQRNYWLVMTAAQRDTLLDTEDAHGNTHGRVGLVACEDDRWAMCADQLSMIYPGGWFSDTWAALKDDWKSGIQITDTPKFLPQEGEI